MANLQIPAASTVSVDHSPAAIHTEITLPCPHFDWGYDDSGEAYCHVCRQTVPINEVPRRVYPGGRAEGFPNINSAVKTIREKLGFKGTVVIKPLGHCLGKAKSDGTRITFDPRLEERRPDAILEAAVHEALHSLGMQHMENFRSGSGRRCEHGWDHLSHWVATLIAGKDTFEQMKFRHEHLGAHSSLLLRQLVMVENIMKRQRGIENALGGCKYETTDGRAARWARMTPEQRSKQIAAMQAGRMRALGWEVYLPTGNRITFR